MELKLNIIDEVCNYILNDITAPKFMIMYNYLYCNRHNKKCILSKETVCDILEKLVNISNRDKYIMKTKRFIYYYNYIFYADINFDPQSFYDSNAKKNLLCCLKKNNHLIYSNDDILKILVYFTYKHSHN